MYIQKLEQIKNSPRSTFTPEQLKKHNNLHNKTGTKKTQIKKQYRT